VRAAFTRGGAGEQRTDAIGEAQSERRLRFGFRCGQPVREEIERHALRR
jgi:hypothetical protein